MQPDSPSSGSGPERTSRDAVPTAASPDGAWLSPGLLRAAFVWTCERGRGRRELDVPAMLSARCTRALLALAALPLESSGGLPSGSVCGAEEGCSGVRLVGSVEVTLVCRVC